MIARTWHGMTPASKADEYLAFLQARALPDYQRIPGNRGAWVLRREDGERTHFTTLTFWDSREAIAAFAGQDISLAKYYPEDRDFLLEFETHVQHSELYGDPACGRPGGDGR